VFWPCESYRTIEKHDNVCIPTSTDYAIVIASGKAHPTYLYNLCGLVLSSVQVAQYLYLGITLTDELSWSSHVHSIHQICNRVRASSALSSAQ